MPMLILQELAAANRIPFIMDKIALIVLHTLMSNLTNANNAMEVLFIALVTIHALLKIN